MNRATNVAHDVQGDKCRSQYNFIRWQMSLTLYWVTDVAHDVQGDKCRWQIIDPKNVAHDILDDIWRLQRTGKHFA